MPSDRDLAQQWLAETIARAFNPADTVVMPEDFDAYMHAAAAILDTPGVVVAASWSLHGPGPGRLVIELPIEPSTQRTGEAAHQHDEEQG